MHADQASSEFYNDKASKDGKGRWCKECKKKQKKSEQAKLDSWRFNIMERYGVTESQYLEMLESQGNVCAICGKTPEENGRRLSIDHDHKTGRVRGLLCIGCNRALGYFRDRPEIMLSAAEYLGGPLQTV